ncbi:MAG: hypothetical protein C0594_04640 [Marinilabiliales bacterium]|nr:MAG: hypothetical protein C0594_04640 [Marinilabiliales bacterium]
MKYLIPVSFLFLLVLSCEKLAEEDTPLCNDCYNVTYRLSDDTPIDTTNEKTLCGGDIINWKTIPEETTDSTVTRYLCD